LFLPGHGFCKDLVLLKWWLAQIKNPPEMRLKSQVAIEIAGDSRLMDTKDVFRVGEARE
jgi:hypothetical protein